MVDDSVLQLARDFEMRIAPVFQCFPALRLDRGWLLPWLSDHICRFLRYRTPANQFENDYLTGIAALNAELVDRCWTTFAGHSVETIKADGVECIATANKSFFRSDVNRFPIERVYRQVLAQPRSPFPVFGKQLIVFSDSVNALGPVTMGACFGMSSYGEGSWTQHLPGEVMDHIKSLVPMFAQDCADYYRQVYGDGLPGDAKLYTHELIWPPGNYHGDVYGTVAAMGILDFETTHRPLTEQELFNLARFPDTTISQGALVALLARLPNDACPRGLPEITFPRAPDASGLRAAIQNVATRAGREIDWLATRARARFEFEKRMHLLPLINLPWEMAINPANRAFVEAMVNVDAETAVAEFEKLPDKSSTEMRFQRAMLDKVRGDYPTAQAHLDTIDPATFSSSPADFLNEHGMNFLNLGQVAPAIERLREAAAHPDGQRWKGNFAWALMSDKRYDEALAVLDEVVELPLMPVTALLNRRSCYLELGEQGKADADLDAAIAISPFDRRCIQNVMMAVHRANGIGIHNVPA